MNFKAIALAAAVLAQPLSLVPGLTTGSAFAATTGGGGGGVGGGNNEGGGASYSVMQNGTCQSWNYQAAEEAVRLQKEICPQKVSTANASSRAQ